MPQRNTSAILEVAILATRGLDQAAIAQALGISQTTVSRRLRDARESGYILYPLPQLRRENIDSTLLRHAEDSLSFAELSAELRPLLNALSGLDFIRTLSIVRTSSHKASTPEWLDRLKLVCQLAARDLPDMLARASAVGVAWGNTLRFLLDELRARTLHISNPPTIFPVVGSFPYTEEPYPLALTSTHIAADFAEIIHGKIPDSQVSLAAVPAFIPAGIEREPLEKFFSTLPGFREVFGAPGARNARKHPGALLSSADMLISGLGDMPSREGGSPALRERLKHENASLEEWSNMTPGDIGGVLLPRAGIREDQRKQVADINKRFIGIGLKDFQACAERSHLSDGRKPGVLVVAHDRSKSAAVIEAVRNRCVSHLFIDENLAVELRHQLDADLQATKRSPNAP